MKDRWIIHTEGQVLGPWTAARVRDELRSGRIDAFDLVSSEGSSVKRSLIEVDELFDTSRIQPAAMAETQGFDDDLITVTNIIPDSPQKPSEVFFKTEDSKAESTNHFAPVVSEKGKKIPPPQSMPQALPIKTPIPRIAPISESFQQASGADTVAETIRQPRVYEALASPEKVNHANPRRQSAPAYANYSNSFSAGPPTPTSSKRYVIWLPGTRPQGPFSSKDILTLWYAKKINANASIQRMSDTRRIPILKFVQFYERAASSGMVFMGQARLATADRSLFWLILGALASLFLVLGAWGWRHKAQSDGSIVLPPFLEALKESYFDHPVSEDELSKVTFEHSDIDEETLRAHVKGAETGSVTIEPVLSDSPAKAQSPAPVKRAKVVETVKRAKAVPRTETVRNGVSKGLVGAGGFSTPQSGQILNTTSLSVQPPAQKIASSPLPIKSIETPKWIEGSTVTLTGYRFNLAQLTACPAKCRLVMNGAKGSITAVFFKESFAAVLASKTNGATITGTVSRDASTKSVVIFVQNIQ